MNPFVDRSAIAGIGYTKFSANSGVSTLTLALRAISAALEDAGLTPADVDGIASFRVGDSTPPPLVANSLGIRNLAYCLDQFGGGSTSHAVVGHAAMAVATGMAECVVCYRAINARSEFRMGGSGRPPVDAIETQYQAPYGYTSPPQQFAMMAQAHMLEYGTTEEQLGAVAVQQRYNASLNERALKRTPFTLSEYLQARKIVEPLKLLDCCLETDGAVALVITRAERARSLKQPPVLIRAAAWGGGHTLYSNGRDTLTTTAAAQTGERLYRMAELTPADIDVAMLYDCFTYSVIVQLEDYGFCAKGEGGPFVASGATSLDGSLPVNTHGGFLSEGYVHGLNHIAEAVSQLRGHAGVRQVKGAKVALSTGQPGYVAGNTSALILRKDG